MTPLLTQFAFHCNYSLCLWPPPPHTGGYNIHGDFHKICFAPRKHEAVLINWLFIRNYNADKESLRCNTLETACARPRSLLYIHHIVYSNVSHLQPWKICWSTGIGFPRCFRFKRKFVRNFLGDERERKYVQSFLSNWTEQKKQSPRLPVLSLSKKLYKPWRKTKNKKRSFRTRKDHRETKAWKTRRLKNNGNALSRSCQAIPLILLVEAKSKKQKKGEETSRIRSSWKLSDSFFVSLLQRISLRCFKKFQDTKKEERTRSNERRWPPKQTNKN